MVPTQAPLRDNAQCSQETGIHIPGGIRTRNPNKQVTADLRLRPRGHWNRLLAFFIISSTWACVCTPPSTESHFRL